MPQTFNIYSYYFIKFFLFFNYVLYEVPKNRGNRKFSNSITTIINIATIIINSNFTLSVTTLSDSRAHQFPMKNLIFMLSNYHCRV
jgi:hypothetical protein